MVMIVVSPAVAARAIAIGVFTNTGMKLALALLFGSRRFKAIAGGAKYKSVEEILLAIYQQR